ncbi:MAG: gene transfer agent family protein [Pikeienuella sp.]
MMVNPHRGETTINVAGTPLTMRLSLGALASLEERLGVTGLVGIAERFEAGEHSADDLLALLTAGLNGAGGDVTEAEVANMSFDGGAIAASRAAAELLARTFQGAP